MWKSIVLAATLVAVSAGAVAAQTCNARDEVLAMLGSRYQESPVALGVTTNGKLIEVLKSGQGAARDTWTIVITEPNGVTCLVAAGEGLRILDAAVGEPEA